MITVCGSCEFGRAGFAELLSSALLKAGLDSPVKTVECMSGCQRPSTCSFRSPGKTAYLFGDLSNSDLADLVRFAEVYEESVDGNFEDARVIGGLRFKAIARIPG